MTNEEARERVARGAALLDEKRLGWAERINLDKFRLGDECACVLGQLGGSTENSFIDAVGRLFNEQSFNGPLTAVYGFTATLDEAPQRSTWECLEEAWIDAITERLTPPATWTMRDPVAATGAERCELAGNVVP